MLVLITTVFSLCVVPTCKTHSVVAEYKHLDNNVLRVLFHPLSEEDWDTMLKTVDYYIMKLMNHGLRISTEVETDKKMANKVVNSGRPKFMNYTVNVKELTEELNIPYEKIERFYEMCRELDKTWVEFVKIVKAMKWQKHKRETYIVQGAFHGRRLGRKKGRRKPYSMEVKKKEVKEEEIDYDKLKEYESKSSEYE